MGGWVLWLASQSCMMLMAAPLIAERLTIKPEDIIQANTIRHCSLRTSSIVFDVRDPEFDCA